MQCNTPYLSSEDIKEVYNIDNLPWLCLRGSSSRLKTNTQKKENKNTLNVDEELDESFKRVFDPNFVK